MRIHISVNLLLEAIALLVIGLPMCRVEKLVGIKGETVKTKLLQLLDGRLWENLKYVLENRHRIPRSYLSDFAINIAVARDFEVADFSDWAKELTRRDAAERAHTARLASMILKRRVKVSEIVSTKRGRQGGSDRVDGISQP